MKKSTHIILLILTTLVGSSYAQTINYNDAFYFGNIKDDYATKITVDSKGNSITGGSYDSITTINGIDSLASYRGHDAILIKQDSSGNIVWSKTFGAPGVDQVTAIATDVQDNIYIAVRSSGALILGNDTVGWARYEDPFIAKLDPSGNFIWAKSFKSVKSSTRINTLKLAKNGDIYVSGQFIDSMAIHGHKLIGDYYEGFVARFNKNGDYISLTKIGGPDYDVALGLVITEDKGFVVTGNFRDSVHFNNNKYSYNSAGTYYGYLAKYDSNFVCSWVKNLYNSAPYVDIDHNQNLLVNFGKSVKKYDRNGVQLWNTNFSQVARINGAVFNDQDEIIIYGDFGTFSVSTDTITIDTTQLISNGNVDFFFSKLDSNGNILWAGSDGGSGYDKLSSMSVFGQNKIYASGIFKSPSLTFGNFLGTNSNSSTYDGFIFNFDLNVSAQTTGINSFIKKLKIYPNPTTGNLRIENNSKKVQSITIFNLMGAKVLEIEENTNTVNVSDLNNGMYFIQVNYANSIGYSQFIKN